VARRKFNITPELLTIGEFSVDIKTRQITYYGQEIALSRKEFDLLSYLLLHKNRVLTRVQLSEHIWGTFVNDDYDSNYIDAHIKNIRKKIGAYGQTDWLETVRGVGYRIKK
jgi:DNA-binding response OmpR family regulator